MIPGGSYGTCWAPAVRHPEGLLFTCVYPGPLQDIAAGICCSACAHNQPTRGPTTTIQQPIQASSSCCTCTATGQMNRRLLMSWLRSFSASQPIASVAGCSWNLRRVFIFLPTKITEYGRKWAAAITGCLLNRHTRWSFSCLMDTVSSFIFINTASSRPQKWPKTMAAKPTAWFIINEGRVTRLLVA